MTNLGKIAFVVAVLFLAACTTIQTRATAVAQLKNVGLDQAFRSSTEAALEAGFTLSSVSKGSDSGFILAVRSGNQLLTWGNPVINIYVSENMGTSTIHIASTVGHQMVDYGTTSSVVDDFCNALGRIQRGALCING